MATYDPNQIPDWVSDETSPVKLGPKPKREKPKPLEEGFYAVMISEVRDKQLKSGTPIVEAKYLVMEPATYKGQAQEDSFFLDAPDSFGMRRYRNLFQAAGVAMSGDTKRDAQTLMGCRVIIRTYLALPLRRDGTPNPKAGQSMVGEYFAAAPSAPRPTSAPRPGDSSYRRQHEAE